MYTQYDVWGRQIKHMCFVHNTLKTPAFPLFVGSNEYDVCDKNDVTFCAFLYRACPQQLHNYNSFDNVKYVHTDR